MENISLELILFSFLVLVIIVDYAVKKLKQKPSTQKKDMVGALEAIQNAIFFEEKIDKTPSGNTLIRTSNKLSALLEKSFLIKWNTLPYGDKNGACEDLKGAADIDIDYYYDFYIKNCN